MNKNILPYRIKISNNPNRQGVKYFIPVMIVFWLSSFAFSGMIPYGNYVGFGSIILGILFMILIFKKDQNSKRTLELTEEGILEIKKGNQTFIRWSEYHQTYFNGANIYIGGVFPIGSVISTQIVTKDSQIRNILYPMNTFHETLLSLSHKHVYPIITRKLQENGRISFGPIELTQNHLYIKNKEYNRNEIKKIKVENGKIIIKLKNEWVSTSLMISEIPNFYSLMELIHCNLNT